MSLNRFEKSLRQNWLFIFWDFDQNRIRTHMHQFSTDFGARGLHLRHRDCIQQSSRVTDTQKSVKTVWGDQIEWEDPAGTWTQAPLSSSFAPQVQVFLRTCSPVVIKHPNPCALVLRTPKHVPNTWALNMWWFEYMAAMWGLAIYMSCSMKIWCFSRISEMM